jgi:hypothetical protein
MIRYYRTPADLGPLERTPSGDLVAEVRDYQHSIIHGVETIELIGTGKRALALGGAS